MPCLPLIAALFFPRLALFLLWFFSNYLERAYHGILIPLAGFFFLPLTTIVYAWEVNSHMRVSGSHLLWIVLAVLIDLGVIGGGNHFSRSRR